jgi:hypothetical protein
MVRLNGTVVFARNWDNPHFGVVDTNWRPKGEYDYGFSNIPNGFAKGNAMQLEAGKPYPIEILIGEQPGGSAFFCLLVEKQGVEYRKDGKGNPILPIFRLAEQKGSLPQGEYPPHEDKGPIWKGVARPSGSLLDALQR